MKQRYRLVRRGSRNTFYCVDTTTGQRTSLGTSDPADARRQIHGKNESVRQPMLNLQMAKVYLAGTHSHLATRTWGEAVQEIIASKKGANQERWRTISRNRALSSLLPLVIVETDAAAFLKVLRAGTVSTNVYLRRIHNFCLDMAWLLAPVIPKRQWPVVVYMQKRAITREEHEKIIGAEPVSTSFFKRLFRSKHRTQNFSISSRAAVHRMYYCAINSGGCSAAALRPSPFASCGRSRPYLEQRKTEVHGTASITCTSGPRGQSAWTI